MNKKMITLTISEQTLAVVEAGMDSLLKTGGLLAFDKVAVALSEIKSQIGQESESPKEKELDG